ncbi:MAG: ATP-binding cassette domain-containing protein, partial [Pirellulaceae bacterium]
RRRSIKDEVAIRSQTVYLPDDVWLPGEVTGREYLLQIAGLYGIEPLWAMEHADQLLQLFQLVREGDWPMRSYSSGQKKKITLCSAVISQAPIMLLDEPFSGGLDPAGIFAFKRILQRLIQKQAATVVLTTPVGELVEELAGRVIVVRHGQIAADGTVAELRRQSKAGGPLEEVLEQLVHPQLMESILAYFEVMESQ